MAVPGPITSTTSSACHQLIRQGAHLVTSADEVLDGMHTSTTDRRSRPA
jgi:DNA processing protein